MPAEGSVVTIIFEWFSLFTILLYEPKKEDMKSRFLLLTGLMSLAWVAFGQSPVEGVIRDKLTGEAIAGAHVHLNGSFMNTFTNAEGKFYFTKILPGSYALKVTHVSYNTIERSVIITKEQKVLEVLMDPALHLPEDLVITAVRSDARAPGAATLVTREELKQVNMGQDVPFLLATTPSAVTTSDAGTGIGYTGMRIRGIDQNRINVTINGVPLNDPESHSVYWVDLPDFASSAEDIQVQRGVGTSTNGAGAFGASINIMTEKLNPKPYAATSHVAGSFHSLKSNLAFGSGLMNQKFAFDGRISRISSDGFIDRASSSLLSFYLSGGYYGKNTIFKAILMSGREVTYQAWGGIPSGVLDTNRTWNPQGLHTSSLGATEAYDNQVDDYQQTHYQLHLMHRFNPVWSANAALFLTTGKGFYEEYKEDEGFGDYGLPLVVNGSDTLQETDLVRRKWLDNRFGGLVWSVQRHGQRGHLTFGGAGSLYMGDHYGTLVWIQHQGSAAMDHEWYRGDGEKKDVNVFAKYLYTLSPVLTLFADAQFRYIDYAIQGIDDDLRDITRHETYPFFNPKAGFTYSHNDRHLTWLMAGAAHREPNRSNFTDARPGQPVPEAERLINLEAGHRMTWNRWSVEANLFVMQYHNQLVLTGEINDVGSPVMTNVDSSYRAGLELGAGARLFSWLTWEANLSLSRNRILHFNVLVDDWDTWGQREEHLESSVIAFSPSVVGNSVLRFVPSDRFTISLISQYVGRQYLDNTASSDRMLDPWFVNHLHLQYILKVKNLKECRFTLMVNNLLNEEYESNGWVYRYYENGELKAMDGLYPQAGIHVLGGVTLQF